MQLAKVDTSEAIKYFLEIWKQYMLAPDDELGFPKKCSLFATGGVHTFDDLCENVDHNTADAVNAVIESLPLHHQAAIQHFNLHAVFRFPRMSVDDVYADALVGLEIGLRKKGLL